MKRWVRPHQCGCGVALCRAALFSWTRGGQHLARRWRAWITALGATKGEFTRRRVFRKRFILVKRDALQLKRQHYVQFIISRGRRRFAPGVTVPDSGNERWVRGRGNPRRSQWVTQRIVTGYKSRACPMCIKESGNKWAFSDSYTGSVNWSLTDRALILVLVFVTSHQLQKYAQLWHQ